MRWISMQSGAFGETERFLSNLTHVEEDSGDLSGAIVALERLTAANPRSPRAAAQLLRLSGLYSKAGDDKKRKAILIRVRDGDYPEEFREMARRALDSSVNSGQGLAEIQSGKGSGSASNLILLVNGLIVLGLIGVMWARRRSANCPSS
jgi:hypothetical protein